MLLIVQLYNFVHATLLKIKCHFFYDEPEPCEDIKSNKDSDVITESHFEQDCITKGMAPSRSKYRFTNFRLYFDILFSIFPPNGTTSA